MAYVYNVEPNTNGKVVLHTTAGDVDIELWSEQAPLACPQLCTALSRALLRQDAVSSRYQEDDDPRR